MGHLFICLGFPEEKLNDVESVDWAPTVNLGYQREKPMSGSSRQREEKMRRREQQQKSPEDGEALLTVQETAVNPEDSEDISDISNDDPKGKLI